MTYKFKIDNDDLSQTKYFDGVSGNKNVYICEFDISCDEGSAVWFAVFKKGDENYVTPVVNGKCAFPYECLEEPCSVYLGCYAECEGNKRISTNWLPLKVESGAYSQGTAPGEPSADLWETLLSNSVPVIGENGNWLTYDMQENEYIDTGFAARGERGIQGEKGDKGDTGVAGYTPQKGVDYFTEADITESREESLALLCPKAETTERIITDAISHNVIDYTIYGNDGGVGDLVVDGDDDYAEHGGEYRIPITVHGKNLFDMAKNTDGFIAAYGGVTNQYNDDHTVLTVSSASATGRSGLFSLGTFNTGTYYISAVFKDNINIKAQLLIAKNGNVIPSQISVPNTVSITAPAELQIYGSLNQGKSPYTLSEVQIEQGSLRTPYEPYIARTINIYLDEPLGEGQSVSLAETNIPIPLVSNDKNIIEFGTSVQPSSVRIKYYQDINKVIANLQALILNQ